MGKYSILWEHLGTKTTSEYSWPHKVLGCFKTIPIVKGCVRAWHHPPRYRFTTFFQFRNMQRFILPDRAHTYRNLFSACSSVGIGVYHLLQVETRIQPVSCGNWIQDKLNTCKCRVPFKSEKKQYGNPPNKTGECFFFNLTLRSWRFPVTWRWCFPPT